MKMLAMTCSVTGKTKRIFDLESIECVEYSPCGKEIWVYMHGGHKFIAGEMNNHNPIPLEEIMRGFSESFKKLEATND